MEMSDAQKLRVLADWFDKYDQSNVKHMLIGGGMPSGKEVQADLRRIADSLERKAPSDDILKFTDEEVDKAMRILLDVKLPSGEQVELSNETVFNLAVDWVTSCVNYYNFERNQRQQAKNDESDEEPYYGIKNISCKCTKEEQTGWTEMKCCNLCGLPVEEWWTKKSELK